MLDLAAGPGHLVSAGPLLLAAPVAVAAGVLSFFSPCCLPLLPGYLGYLGSISGQPQRQTGQQPAEPESSAGGVHHHRVRAASNGTGVALLAPAPTSGGQAAAAAGRQRPVLATVLFVLGFAAVFVSYGAAFGGIGFTLQRHQLAVSRVLGALTIMLGLLFAGVLARLPLGKLAARTVRLRYRPRLGVASAPALGVLFAVGWTPCIGPTLAAVLLLGSSSGTAGRGAILAFLYALGLGVPFVAVAAAAGRVMRGVAFARRHAVAVTRAGATLLIAVGILEVSGAWMDLVARLQTLISGTVLPL